MLLRMSRGLAPSSPLSLFAKVSLIFSCKQPKVACFQNFCWHSSISVAVYSNNLIWHKHLVFPFDVQRSRSKFLALLSLHSKPEPRLSRKGWSGSGCCVAIFYCQIPHRTLKIERPSAWDTRRWPHKGSTDDCANRRSKEEVLAQCSNFCKQANSAPQKLAKHKRRAGKRRRKGAGNPCRENGTSNLMCSKWAHEVILSGLYPCGQIVYMDTVRVTFDLDLTFCQAMVKFGKCWFPVLTKWP